MPSGANVKGSALSSRLLWVDLHRGGAGRARLLARCSPELRAAIAAGIAKAGWYPLAHLIELSEAIDGAFGAGDGALVREVARFGADANLTTIYRLCLKVGSVHWLLGHAARLWHAHFDTGYLEMMTRGPRGAVARVRGFAAPHPVHCASVASFGARSLELSGAAGVRVVETRCRTRGDDLCQFEASWE